MLYVLPYPKHSTGTAFSLYTFVVFFFNASFSMQRFTKRPFKIFATCLSWTIKEFIEIFIAFNETLKLKTKDETKTYL